MAKDAFRLYDALIRLSGSRDNEVRKNGITAPEVMLLGSIHGSDSIVEAKPVAPKAFAQHRARDENGVPTGDPMPRTNRQERNRLIMIYEGTDARKRGFVQRVFGPATMALPTELEDDFKPSERIDVRTPSAIEAGSAEPHAALIG